MGMERHEASQFREGDIVEWVNASGRWSGEVYRRGRSLWLKPGDGMAGFRLGKMFNSKNTLIHWARPVG